MWVFVLCLCCLIAIVVVAITAKRSRKSVPSAIGSGSDIVPPQLGMPIFAFRLLPISDDGSLPVLLAVLGTTSEKG